jgi:hypothetical protein
MRAAFSFAGCCLVLLTSCGNKPDGTPYGINPKKHADGHRITAADSVAHYGSYEKGMPKGAEMNAVTSGATVGQTPTSDTQLPPH